MLSNELLTCLVDLCSTQSPSSKLNHILTLALSLSSRERTVLEPLILQLKGEIAKKRAQGSLGGRTKAKNKANKSAKRKSYKHPMFALDFSGGELCLTCKEIVPPGPAFRWMRDGNYETYHALPCCEPEGADYESITQWKLWKSGSLIDQLKKSS